MAKEWRVFGALALPKGGAAYDDSLGDPKFTDVVERAALDEALELLREFVKYRDWQHGRGAPSLYELQDKAMRFFEPPDKPERVGENAK